MSDFFVGLGGKRGLAIEEIVPVCVYFAVAPRSSDPRLLYTGQKKRNKQNLAFRYKIWGK